MSVIENEGCLTYVDESGNKFLMYPITRVGLVDGLSERLDEKQDSITGQAGQIVGFDSTGAVVAQNANYAPSSHVDDGVKHITAAERNAWNAKLDSFTETDPTVPAWAKAASKPTYTASEVGADASGSAAQALTDAKSYTDTQIAAIPTPDVSGQINTHNTSTSAHNDIRELVNGLTTRLNALADSDDTTLDQLSEIVAYIKNNKSLIDGITTSKVNVDDIINNLTTNVTNKPLSAAQGVALKALVDAIVVPTKVSELTNDSGYLTSFTETDPTVPAWAKASSKPSYTASEVGATPASHANDTTAHITSAERTAWNAKLDSFTETDPTVPAWAKADSKPTYTADEVGAAPASHTSDTTIHITDDERTVWNAKANAPFKPSGKSYLTFSSPNSFTLNVNDTTKHWDGTLEYFDSDKTWAVWDGTTTLSSVDNDGDNVLYLRGTGNTVISAGSMGGEYSWTLIGTDIKCIGNIENLLDYATVASGEHPSMADYCYYYMFPNCTALTKAPDLPAITLATNCYSRMFYGCTSLTQAPALPATTLANYCYNGMFAGCTSLTQVPSLPAMTLAKYCYMSMFYGCTSLTKAPSLPATTLASHCYENMFRGCTSLTQAPSLPATTLQSYCYPYMFYGCTSLKLSSTSIGEYTQEYRIPSSGIGTTETDALTNMFSSTGGTFAGTPTINTTYYLSTDNMVVRETDIATLNGYVGSMIDAAIGNAIGGSY